MKDGSTRAYSQSLFDKPYVELSSERSDIRWHARVRGNDRNLATKAGQDDIVSVNTGYGGLAKDF